MAVFTQRISVDDAKAERSAQASLALTAEERTRARFRYPLGEDVAYLQLPRGTYLKDGDLLVSEMGEAVVQVVAKPEPVMTVTTSTPLGLLRAAYHLGNRHVPLELTETYLRLSPDPVLKTLLIEQLGVEVREETVPFKPEAGAYRHHHAPKDEHHHH